MNSWRSHEKESNWVALCGYFNPSKEKCLALRDQARLARQLWESICFGTCLLCIRERLLLRSLNITLDYIHQKFKWVNNRAAAIPLRSAALDDHLCSYPLPSLTVLGSSQHQERAPSSGEEQAREGCISIRVRRGLACNQSSSAIPMYRPSVSCSCTLPL